MSRHFTSAAALAAVAAALLAVSIPGRLSAQGSTEQIACGVSSGVRQTCNAHNRVTAVSLTRNLGETACRQNVNWGFNNASLWTSGGCRGDFRVTYRGGNPGVGIPGGGVTTRVIPCGGRSGQHECKTNGYATGVRLLADKSASSCRQNSNWGFTDSFVWANGGCWGQFEVTYRGDGGAKPNTRVIACGSASGDNSCNAFGQVASVRLVRALSRNCRQGSTWGFSKNDLWTKQGCRGDFEVTYVRPVAQPR